MVSLQNDCMYKYIEATLLVFQSLYKRRPDATINEHSIYWTSDGILALRSQAHGLYFHYGSQIYEFVTSGEKIEVKLLGSKKPKADDISLYESMASMLLRAALEDDQVPKISRLADIAKEKLTEADYFNKEGVYQSVYSTAMEA